MFKKIKHLNYLSFQGQIRKKNKYKKQFNVFFKLFLNSE